MVRSFVVVGLVSLLAGCGMAPHAMVQARTTGLAARAEDAAASKAAFVKAAAAKGVKLTADQLDLIQHERNLVPNGQWAPRPAEKV